MKTFTKSAVTSLLLACASTSYAVVGGDEDFLCIPVDGTVTSEYINCSVTVEFQAALCPLGEGFGPGQCIPENASPTPVCFRITGKGKARILGDKSFSRLTVVPVVDPFAPALTATPLVFPLREDPSNERANLSVFTSNASLTGKIRSYSGTLYTRDTGVITEPTAPDGEQTVGQVLKIVGGSPGSDFEGATGTIAVAGQEVGSGAFYTGEVCVRRNK